MPEATELRVTVVEQQWQDDQDWPERLGGPTWPPQRAVSLETIRPDERHGGWAAISWPVLFELRRAEGAPPLMQFVLAAPNSLMLPDAVFWHSGPTALYARVGSGAWHKVCDYPSMLGEQELQPTTRRVEWTETVMLPD